MDLRDATRTFVAGYGVVRRLSGPYQVETRGEAAWMHDPTARRMGELVGAEMEPQGLVARYSKGERGAICALYSGPFDDHKRTFQALGWRLLRTEPMFAHDLQALPSLDPRAERASSAEHVARVAQAARMRPATMGVEDVDDAAIRLYEVSMDGQSVGWVRSVRANDEAWVSSLNVRETHRRKGLGRALMAALLHDDARLGRRTSVLLASHSGARLYPTLGYERVGTMLILMPIKVDLQRNHGDCGYSPSG